MFLMKKIVALFFYPVPLCMEIVLVGLVFLWLTRRQRTGRIIVTLGFLLLLGLGYGRFSDGLLASLETWYPPVVNPAGHGDVKWVVVLGGGHTSDSRLPTTSQLEHTSVVRLVEGVHLHRMLPGSRLVLSGGSAFDPVPNAVLMADLARSLGVKDEAMIIESLSRDTEEEARLIQEIVAGEEFLLVTSAAHMPRSVGLFRRVGANPIPAPTGHRVKHGEGVGPDVWFPSAWNLTKAQEAFHEYMGLAWAWIRGKI
jgi:uncharacterized SAM-binding protein YcdF (DUF218 family)